MVIITVPLRMMSCTGYHKYFNDLDVKSENNHGILKPSVLQAALCVVAERCVACGLPGLMH